MSETGTVRTQEELMSIFRDGQPTNSVTTEDMRDLVVSVPSLAGGFGRTILENTEFTFSFTPTAESGQVLNAGSTNTVTLSPVPRGVNGNNVGHYVYISGGSGVPEAVLITGGSAVSEAASGTIAFVPANSHTGAWAITSATHGIQEAVNYAYTFGARAVQIGAGEHTVSPITVLGPMLVQGVGWGTKLISRTPSSRIFTMVNSAFSHPYDGTGQANCIFRDMQVSARGHSGDTAVGFYFWGQTFITIENVLFDDINYGVFLDKCFFVKILNCQGLDDTSLFIGSTTASESFFRSADIRITNYSYKYSTTPDVITMGRKLIHLQGAICVRMTDVSLADMFFRGYPISIEWGCEDVMIQNCNMLRGINNIQMLEATIGGNIMSPVSVSIIGGACAGYGARAVYVKNGFLILLQGVDLTGVIDGTGMEVAAVEVDKAFAVTINGCRFMLSLHGYSILVNGGPGKASDVIISSNVFRQLSTAADVRITGVVSGLTITDNIHSFSSTGTVFLENLNTLAEQLVYGNLGIDDVGQSVIGAASFIELRNPVVTIVSSGTITNIAPPAYYTDTIIVAPAPGSTWIMDALGNIANPPATHPTVPFQMRYVENAIGGAKWYVIGLGGIIP